MSNALAWARQYIAVPDAMYREHVEELLRMAERGDSANQSNQRGLAMGDLVAWESLKKLAEEQFEARAKHARESKQSAIESGDTGEAQCFSCELQMLSRGFDSWLMAHRLMRQAEIEARLK